MKKILIFLGCLYLYIVHILAYAGLPPGFVYLKDVAPSIQQDIRYATAHNFIGHPIAGYQAGECILTKPAALALAKIQTELKASALSLKVYDCYRPQQAVDEFVAWSKKPELQQMKAEFYPRIDKADFFKLGYAAEKSGHSRGSTMDLTIVPIPITHQEKYNPKKKLVSCFAPYLTRFQDGSIDMGTGFDCMDELSHNDNTEINEIAQHNRQLLQMLMVKYGFEPLKEEWWHFTLKNEPYPHTFFNFPIVSHG